LPSTFAIAAFNATTVVLARVRFAHAEGVTLYAHVGFSDVSGAIFRFQVLWVLFVGVIVENAARSFEQHVEGLASRVFNTHLCAK